MKSMHYLVLLLCIQLRVGAEILVPPHTQTVPLGSTASFFCSGRGQISRWAIDGDVIFNDGDLKSKGFNFTETEDLPAQIHNISITVVAVQELNNTKIQCQVYIDGQPTNSAPAYLIAIGSPLPVQATLQVASATTLVLQWEPPFTYENYPILQYNVRLLNTSSGEIIRNETRDNVTNSMTHSVTEVEKVCAELQFTITAENAIGQSISTRVTGGFPVAPGPFQSEIGTRLVFMQDGTPEMDIQFKPPQICTYQWATYTIIITGQGVREEIVIVRIGPNNYSNDDVIMEKIVSPGLEMDKQYSIEVIVETRAGNTTAGATFNTNFRPISPIKPSTEGVQNEKDVSLVIVIAGSVGGACLLALLGITALLVCICGQRKRIRSRRVFGSTSSRPPMVTNPIYEGVVYESIDEGKLMSVINTNSPTASEEFPQFPSNRSSQDYENTKKASENTGASSSPPVTPNEDNYTMMNPAGPDNERSNIPSNDTLRYVPEPVTLV